MDETASAKRAAKVRVAIVSDTHGVLDPRVAEVVRKADIAVHGGDVGSAAALDALEPHGGEVLAVRGNNDVPRKLKTADDERLLSLPEEIERELPGGVLAVIHGHQFPKATTRHRALRERFPEARAVVYGHSHHLIRDRSARPWVLNPGAAGRSRTFGGPSCLVLTATQRRWTVTERRFPV
jgi:hypothetical protein